MDGNEIMTERWRDVTNDDRSITFYSMVIVISSLMPFVQVSHQAAPLSHYYQNLTKENNK